MIKVKEKEILAPYTMYKIGGPADFFVEVSSPEEMKEALMFSMKKKRPFFILGAGSNTLVSDAGFRGVVIRNKDGQVRAEGEELYAEAGAMMSKAVLESARAGLTGFEWGIGVPGTVGGSVRGNAGCFGGEMKDIVNNVEVFDSKNFTTYNLQPTTCEFAYRDSIFKKHPELVVLSVTLKLKRGNPEEIKEKIKEITLARSAKQDIGTKSCGCIFKNIEWKDASEDKTALLQKFPELEKFKDGSNIPASFLLDRTGLRGKKNGRVSISPKHANFFVNEGGASAEEVRELVGVAKQEVYNKFGLQLREEIQYLGF